MKEKLLVVVFAGLFIILFHSGCAQEGFVRKQAVCPTIAGASHVGDQSCLDCHEEVVEGFQKTIHGRIADFEVVGLSKGCESCHGHGSIHAEDGDPASIISFKDISKGEASAVCLKCHTSGSLMDWQGSEHSLSDVGCINCHQVHSRTKRLLAQPEPKLCNDCHQDIRVKTLYPSHHPIKEGKMVCSECHQAHGGFLKNLKTEERLNDLCLDCHASKQGPFAFEHEPVVESCVTCHEPHGTVANNLLVQNEPFLCLQCHQFHFHAGKFGDTGTVTDIYGRSITSGPQSWRMAYTTKCTQCHSQIHGSDLPSQGVSGQGKALTR
ncbi:MAG: GSU2203 family decaheme c-type cytochrome [Desulfobacterales bacterium]